MEVLEPIWEVLPIEDPTSVLSNEAFSYTLRNLFLMELSARGLTGNLKAERGEESLKRELLFAHFLINV